MDLFNVLTVNETTKLLSGFEYGLQKEIVNILNAEGRILSSSIVAKYNIPDFRRSTVDGYALNSRDIFGASESIQSLLDLKGEIIMGEIPKGEINIPGQCYYVPTGGALPKGADSVLMIEYTEKLHDDVILASKSTAPGENVVGIGEDIKKDEIVIKKGTKLRAYEIGVLASLGYYETEVFSKPKVGIISTGDEVVHPADEIKEGQIRDINTYLLHSLVKESGCEAINYGIVKDEYDLIKQTLEKALNACDIVLMSGGSSVGKKDNTVKVIEDLHDGEILVHGISIKPGKPTIIGRAENKIIFGLPGHPLACAVIFKIIVSFYIDNILGHSEEVYPVEGRFKINYHKAKGREEILPVTVEERNGEINVYPIFSKSGLITGFSKAWGYMRIQRNEEGIKEGQVVKVYKF